MSNFGKSIEPHVSNEIAMFQRDQIGGFKHLERAHVIGQESTVQHVRVHWHMLLFSLRTRNPHEAFGQMFRIAGAATKTAIGLVPKGNTGGSDISPFKKLPIPADLQEIIDSAKRQT